ncbi:MAG: putative thiamine biosynthesis protein [Alphaproteobacteria bacterium MarineAlpha11_Bin1]|nr:MAG: putative thiamine biosynthesis protein [Alphaproteobacteria bacterium MarineAlpha11_Bin1]|tara:strand:- start:6892 stop:7833 length:942 start_codon:yes stop_codon:yes gene_type:complete
MKLFILTVAIAIAVLTSGSSRASDKMTVLLDWFINPDHAPLYVALERDYFRDAGLDVDFKAPADPNDPPKLVAAGKADLAISYQPQLHLLADRGLPLVRVATLVATPLNSLVVLKDSAIESIKHLEGKTVGFSVGGFEEAILRAMLEKNGLKLRDIKLVNVNFSLSPALISRKVDAVIGAFRNFELNQLDILKKPGRAFYVEEEGVPAYDELIVIANKQGATNKRIKRFVDAIERGVQYLVNHPRESWELFIKGRKELNDELNKRAWRDTLPRFALRPGALDSNRYRKFAAFLKKQGLIKNTLSLSEYAIELR